MLLWRCFKVPSPREKLDDGWPESVEEQGLLLLVWRRNFRNGIWKLCYRQSRRGVSRQNSEKCKTIVCIANTFTHRRFYTDAFTHKAFTHRSFYTQKLLQTEAFTYRSFYIQKLLHTDASTQTLLHTDTFTHRHFYTQTLLHTGAAFTHKRLYTQKLLHIDAFTQKLAAKHRMTATHWWQHAAGLQNLQRHSYRNTRTHKPLCVRKSYSSTRKIAILPQFLPIDHHFVRQGCSGTRKIAILPQFLPIDPHFVRKGCSRTSQIAILPQFLPIDPHFVRKGWRFVTRRRHHPRP